MDLWIIEDAVDRDEERFGDFKEDELLHFDEDFEIAVEIHAGRGGIFEEELGSSSFAVGVCKFEEIEIAVFDVEGQIASDWNEEFQIEADNPAQQVGWEIKDRLSSLVRVDEVEIAFGCIRFSIIEEPFKVFDVQFADDQRANWADQTARPLHETGAHFENR